MIVAKPYAKVMLNAMRGAATSDGAGERESGAGGKRLPRTRYMAVQIVV
jgi:hypothetical protein